MTVTTKIVGSEQVIAKLKTVPDRVRQSVLTAQRANGIDLVGYIVSEKLHGQVLRQRSGRLARSIHDVIVEDGDSIEVKVGTNVEYARIHELGGTTRPHIITARNKKALAFMSGGKQVIVRSVNHPGSRMPERSFLRSSLAERKAAMINRIRGAIAAGL